MNKRILVIGGMLTLFGGIIHSQTPPPIERAQVIVIFDHKDDKGRLVVSVKAKPVLLLSPDSEDFHPAPMDKNTIMLCRPSVEDNHVKFRCGFDKYQMDGINFVPAN
jgi:hypothetical protein